MNFYRMVPSVFHRSAVPITGIRHFEAAFGDLHRLVLLFSVCHGEFEFSFYRAVAFTRHLQTALLLERGESDLSADGDIFGLLYRPIVFDFSKRFPYVFCFFSRNRVPSVEFESVRRAHQHSKSHRTAEMSADEETERLFKRCKASRELCELRNMINIGYLITRQAMERKESRGLHYTIDYPRTEK